MKNFKKRGLKKLLELQKECLSISTFNLEQLPEDTSREEVVKAIDESVENAYHHVLDEGNRITREL